jgi:glycosyltransferase involved in cell wall biosynthesis
MRAIEVIVPTRNRLVKLRRMIESVPLTADGRPVTVTIVSDGDVETVVALRGLVDPHLEIRYVEKHRGAVYCRNLATQRAKDAVLYATDDIEFGPQSIEAAARMMAEKFPDDDGIVGFAQTGNGKYSRAGVALVGQAFLRRYPGKNLFFPGYFHFACQEVLRAALTLDRFAFCEEAKLVHFHPSFDRNFVDHTHVEARKYRGRDKGLSFQRDSQGLTWGIGKEAAQDDPL